jgi:hypothetical protein
MSNKSGTVVFVGGALLATVLVASVLAGYFLQFISAPPTMEICDDREGQHPLPQGTDGYKRPSAYRACIDERAKRFIERDFAETKDLSKAFLTLLTAVLVASITFSEKIVDMKTAGPWSKGLMIGSWLCILGAIVACGTGLAVMTNALGAAAWAPHLDWTVLEGRALILLVFSGVLFVLGLGFLLFAGLISIVQPKAAAVA